MVSGSRRTTVRRPSACMIEPSVDGDPETVDAAGPAERVEPEVDRDLAGAADRRPVGDGELDDGVERVGQRSAGRRRRSSRAAPSRPSARARRAGRIGRCARCPSRRGRRSGSRTRSVWPYVENGCHALQASGSRSGSVESVRRRSRAARRA